MRRLIFGFWLALSSLSATAIPAKPGLWQRLRLGDGTQIEAQLVGDEHLHFWQSADGRRFVMDNDGTARVADMEMLRSNALSRRSRPKTGRRGGQHSEQGIGNSEQSQAVRRTVTMGERTNYRGKKKGIVILMEFKGTKFKTSHDKAFYNDVLNGVDFMSGSYQGSVADYFRAQSGGLFELDFDIAGPYTAKNDASYYGSNDSKGDDVHPDELVVEAVTAADDDFDFSAYDWNEDGEADQVYVLYAGKGEADGGGANTIWPHMWFLSKTDKTVTVDGVTIDTYACSNELKRSGSVDGIGCFCHEFSHCLGYPDLYDIMYQGWFGMSDFDLMCSGSYNGNAFLPAGYSAYEKWMAGWLEPIELAGEDVSVEGLRPISEDGGAYIMYNSGWKDEYYIVENRQLTGWDACLPGKGLMITHVDFDQEIWNQNTPNSRVTRADIMNDPESYTKTNDHQRLTIFHADNDDDSKYWVTYGSYYSKQTLSTDLYPYLANDSLTPTSSPAAMLYNPNIHGINTMEGGITGITQNDDGTMNFVYHAKIAIDPIDDTEKPIEARGDTLFYESFDQCSGTGANDGNWGSGIAQSASKFVTDNEGWKYEAAYAGYQCARFGNVTKVGKTTTPLFTIDGEATLTFNASGWNTDDNKLVVYITSTDDDATIEPMIFTMKSFEWTTFTATLKGTGNVKITFEPMKRFLLDEVLVMKGGGTEDLYGDVNGDGVVDVADIAVIITVMASMPSEPSETFVAADVNGDGVVDVADISAVISVMASGNSEPSESSGASETSIPSGGHATQY